jgi:hypothetical protein
MREQRSQDFNDRNHPGYANFQVGGVHVCGCIPSTVHLHFTIQAGASEQEINDLLRPRVDRLRRVGAK